jgi:hypothetical protein
MQVYPALVTTRRRAADDRLALKYISLIAPMIASIQELKRRDEELEDENAALWEEFKGSLAGLFKTVGVDGPTASSARIGAVSNQDRSCP